MQRNYKHLNNIYLASRLRAAKHEHNLEERAYVIRFLACGMDILVKYETGAANPPEDIVFRMAALYKDPCLILEAFEQNNPMYSSFFRDVFGIKPSRVRLSETVCGYIADLGDLTPERSIQLAGIARDDVIGVNEQPMMEDIAEHMREFVGQAANVLLANTQIKEITATAMAVGR